MATPKSPVVVGLQAKEKIFAKNQPEYMPLPALVSEDKRRIVTTRWELTAKDRAEIAAGADVFISLMTFGHPLQPLLVYIAPKDMPIEVACPVFGVSIPQVVKKGPQKNWECSACGAKFKAAVDNAVCPDCCCRMVTEQKDNPPIDIAEAKREKTSGGDAA